MERDYGMLSEFVKKDEKREKKEQKNDSGFRSKIEALRNMVNKFQLPKSLELDTEGEDKDSLGLKKGMREQKTKKEALERLFKQER